MPTKRSLREKLHGLQEFQCDVHELAKSKGFWDNRSANISDPEALIPITLMHCELSEAVESLRNREKPIWFTEDGKPEGAVVELADTVMRILDYCEAYDLDLTGAMVEKFAYNETRPHMHGGKLT